MPARASGLDLYLAYTFKNPALISTQAGVREITCYGFVNTTDWAMLLQCCARLTTSKSDKARDTVFALHAQSKRARTRIFGLFVAVWVSLAVQPCAVAAVSESDCPHCPPEIEAVAPTTESHCNPAANISHDEQPNCDSAQAACCDVDEGIVNVRVDTNGLDDNSTGLPLSALASHPDIGLCGAPENAAAPPEPSGATVPLHVLKCVYLN